MKTKIPALLLIVLIIVCFTACAKTNPCGANGHKWLENTPNYQQAKTCEVCGATEGEPLMAKNEGMIFAKADTVTDMKMILDGDPNKTNIAKVWFDNYRVFDSDETHEAKEGYEWRSVDLHIAIGDDSEYKKWSSCNESNFIGEYYQDNDWENGGKNVTVNFNGKDYVCEHVFTVLNEERDVSNPEYKKFGWSGEKTYTFEYNESVLVPKGFDGIYVGFQDATELELKNGDNDAVENIVFFRMD